MKKILVSSILWALVGLFLGYALGFRAHDQMAAHELKELERINAVLDEVTSSVSRK
jgi:hypothetical protein